MLDLKRTPIPPFLMAIYFRCPSLAKFFYFFSFIPCDNFNSFVISNLSGMLKNA